ncbi:endonuclease/exonuclease/phosphatase family protein [Acrocarpospora catenulata]|uniref:endonuclease/exonuclease/phosphatase family protein n=1 Tax=Acrocarpospora catenulata TaxID=2836182 RepID=UPI001BD94ACF|nr:endonuclease/exonuclease/phosphatase family protein [Acrocarpospora catenulata]
MVVVGTWNLENLYRPGGQFGPRDEAAYEAKLKALAGTIAQIGPDVLGVQEVGEPAALADLVGLLDGEWHVELSQIPDGRGIRVGFVSRLPLTVLHDRTAFPRPLDPVQHEDDGDTVGTTSRGMLAVRAGDDLTLVAAHLKSKLLSFPGGRFQPRDEGERARAGAYALYRRTAEAVTLRGLADELLLGEGETRKLIVLGDLNDGVEAATTQILVGPPGSEIGTSGERIRDRGDRWRLWNLAPRIPEAERYSRVYHGRPELIDHILVSRALLERIQTVHSVLDHGLPSVGDLPGVRRDTPDSDHAPITVTLAL